MNCRAICLIISLAALALPRPLYAQELEICGDPRQGELLLGKAGANATEVLLNGEKAYPVDENGEFILALPRDAGKNAELVVYYKDDVGHFFNLPVAAATWDVQRVNGVAPRKVNPSAEDAAEIAREQNDVQRALAVNEAGDFWRQDFVLPVAGRISGHFGNQRIFNGVPKSPHSGTDIAAPEGTPVQAAAGGKVVLSGKNYFYTGNMVIVDHGQGLQTIYAHLKTAKVNEGDEVTKGQIIGLVGHTGRATGPHLHWGASLNNVRFRPHSLLEYKQQKCRKLSGSNMAD